ncbi:hypothetical protein GW17_00037139 [Ensete ventricosum]|uniref:Uncharacterized protein n=1 Tax=Ensete ventricosum TaxID=4639 RepID=A0A426ZS01_ENSVE|nr:hypothetical protein B296_00017999 [Ensete ventricosum]RWV99928.1 hypothetical protein GW17_00037139 [Ensete ventricosum]
MCLAPCDCRALKKKLKERMSEFQVASNFHIFQMIFCLLDSFSVCFYKMTSLFMVFVNPCVKFLEFTNFFHSQMQVMDTLAEIHERHNTVKDLERKLLELQQVDHTISNF